MLTAKHKTQKIILYYIRLNSLIFFNPPIKLNRLHTKLLNFVYFAIRYNLPMLTIVIFDFILAMLVGKIDLLIMKSINDERSYPINQIAIKN